MLHRNVLTTNTEGKSLEEVAAIVHAALMNNDPQDTTTIVSQFEWLRDSHHEWTRDEIRSHITNSYINRKLIDIALYSVRDWERGLSDKDRTKFRAEMRRLFQIDLDKVLDEGAKIPQSEIDDALELLKKAGYISFQLPDDQFLDNHFEAHFQYGIKLISGEHESVRIEMQDVDTMQANYESWVQNAIDNVIDSREMDASADES